MSSQCGEAECVLKFNRKKQNQSIYKIVKPCCIFDLNVSVILIFIDYKLIVTLINSHYCYINIFAGCVKMLHENFKIPMEKYPSFANSTDFFQIRNSQYIQKFSNSNFYLNRSIAEYAVIKITK